ncbi:MAG: class I SAM-dependent DNA methyltransferase [Thermoanaerobaculia bacterium]
MQETGENAIDGFVSYAKRLRGDEKGEAQLFCERLFRAFGHAGLKEAGATLEYRLKSAQNTTVFADLVWKPRLLLEMKKRGEKLDRHYRQAFDYWVHLVPNRPRYVVLCNFDEFWVYDFDTQLDQPVDTVALADLPRRYQALNFLFPEERQPLFQNDRVAVTRAAADKVARVFNRLIARGTDRVTAQRFVLQCVVAMFSEDAGLLPRGLFTELVKACRSGESSYDALGALFRQMNNPELAPAGRYQQVRYFNGGLFAESMPVHLDASELELLEAATHEDWSRVQPAIFGSIFESSMGAAERHAYGAHFTTEADIQKVVTPTIVRPWQERIEAASTLKELVQLRAALAAYQVLDPACGSGNFLYVAYREIKRLEIDILLKIFTQFGKTAEKKVGTHSLISTRQFFGIDNNPFGVELAKVTLMLAKELALEETHEALDHAQLDLLFAFDPALPLDNLDANIVCADALLSDWPPADAIIGNPPYQSKNKIQQEYGPAYVQRLRKRFPQVPGRADYCVYWFRKAHDHLKVGGRAGLVGTNTIRQNYSREGGLDHIVATGTITEAVATQVWSGDAAVHVSIVNWIKGTAKGRKKLSKQLGDQKSSPWAVFELQTIGPSLSEKPDVTTARSLRANSESATCYQGQTHGHEAFLLSPDEARAIAFRDAASSKVLKPYMTGDDLLSNHPPGPQRFAIDFYPLTLPQAAAHKVLFERVKTHVLPDRELAAKKEQERNDPALDEDPGAKVNKHHRNFLNKWWHFSYPRGEMLEQLHSLPRYIVCVRVTKRPIFVFVSPTVHPNDALTVFPLADDYSFGILQSTIHWEWFMERCSTLKRDPRYTSDTVFDSFPWPQRPTTKQVENVAAAARHLRKVRSDVMRTTNTTLRELYRQIDLPGTHPIKDAQASLDETVRAAYAMTARSNTLEFLLDLNLTLAKREDVDESIVGPGLPKTAKRAKNLLSKDCIESSISFERL